MAETCPCAQAQESCGKPGNRAQAGKQKHRHQGKLHLPLFSCCPFLFFPSPPPHPRRGLLPRMLLDGLLSILCSLIIDNGGVFQSPYKSQHANGYSQGEDEKGQVKEAMSTLKIKNTPCQTPKIISFSTIACLHISHEITEGKKKQHQKQIPLFLREHNGRVYPKAVCDHEIT